MRNPSGTAALDRFRPLVERGVLTDVELALARRSAVARGRDIERILTDEYCVSRLDLLEALSEHFQCPYIEYDERLPVPPDLIAGLDGERLSLEQWFPIIRDGDTVVIAANNPASPSMRSEAELMVPAKKHEYWVALSEDVQWFIQDFLHAGPGHLIGTERTALAFWRNTMAHWRTRLACYRNDLAVARTNLALLRWGLGIIALANTLMRSYGAAVATPISLAAMIAGFCLALSGLSGYLRIRRSRMHPPRHQTLIEVTAASVQFLEDFHFLDSAAAAGPSGTTMLARLGDFLASHCTILYPSPSSRERSHLARERNVLAAQRTVAACYRTIYSRARTGLAFIRTGAAFTSLGIALFSIYPLGPVSLLDAVLIASGILMITDGIIWYAPVRKEQKELPRCPVPEG